jgi:hypothetical protein
LGVDSVVFRPGRLDGTRKSQDTFEVQRVVGGGSRGEPLAAVFDRPFRIFVDVCFRIGVGGIAPNVLEPPVKWLDVTIVVGGPTAVLVAADATFKPVHGENQQLTVYS